jgi:NADP-dependent 3-hydroxy acid dehydrogenase YdfG
MSFPYKHVLLIGATAGIGRAMADRFIETGVRVTAVGRRQERLDEFVSKHGEGKASAVAFDISDTAKTPAFAERWVYASLLSVSHLVANHDP